MRRNGYMAESSHSTSEKGEIHTETCRERQIRIWSPVEHARLLLLSYLLERGEADTYLLIPVLGDLNWRPLFLFKVR
jgi:hypothetical protein